MYVQVILAKSNILCRLLIYQYLVTACAYTAQYKLLMHATGCVQLNYTCTTGTMLINIQRPLSLCSVTP